MNRCCGLLTVVLVICVLSVCCFSNQQTEGLSTGTTGTADSSLNRVSHLKPSSTQQDNTLVGIDNIVNIVRTIEEMSASQLRNVLENDINNEGKRPIANRVVRNAEYQPFFCDVYCFIRPSDESQEDLNKPDWTNGRKPHFLLECTQSENNPSTVHRIPVNVDCVSHFTGSLIHIVLKVKHHRETPLLNGTLTIGKTFGSTLASVGQFDVSQMESTTTGLYMTLNVPINEITFEDLEPLKPWLRYVALNGEYLETIDKTILTKLALNYFVLEGCNRSELVIDSNDEIPYDLDPSISNCRVVWSYSCGRTVPLDVWADSKTQNQLCHGQSGEYPKRARQGQTRRRNRRSPRHEPDDAIGRIAPQFVRDTFSTPMFTPSSNGIIGKPKHAISNSGSTEREDILWYQNVIILLLILLVLVVVLLALTLVALGLVIRRTLKEKLKPG